MEWKFTDAKNELSKVVNLALSEGMQKINRRDGSVMVISEEDYIKITGQKPSLLEYIRSAPAELEVARDKSSVRDIEL